MDIAGETDHLDVLADRGRCPGQEWAGTIYVDNFQN